METPITHPEIRPDQTARPSHSIGTDTAPEEVDAVEAAEDADRMMRMIVGSVYLDPHDIRRKLDDHSSGVANARGRDIHFGLVAAAVALVFLIFALDLIFLKW